MSDYTISRIFKSDLHGSRQMDLLLLQEGIRRDPNLDYSCGLFDDKMQLVATGSCFGNTLRCLAVSRLHQGEGLMNRIVTHLMEVHYFRGNTHLFLYTKCSAARFFHDLGFYEIARIDGQVVFMENKRNGFDKYLKGLSGDLAQHGADCRGADCRGTGCRGADFRDAAPGSKPVSAIVMNANPFTLGHLYLIEKAAAQSDLLHIFIVSEDVSLVPFQVRKRLVIEGTAGIHNLVYHDSGPYIISNATFPSYFQKDEDAVIESHARLDLAIFARIAGTLGITCRYVGEEPFSRVTGIYNRIMESQLPKAGIHCRVIPRKQANGTAISASSVRNAIRENRMDLLAGLVPDSTYRYFCSGEAGPVIRAITSQDDVIHY